MRPDPDFRCARCPGIAWPIDKRTVKEVTVDKEKLEAVSRVCYLVDMLYAGGGYELAAVILCKCGWDQFRQLLYPLTDHNLLLVNRDRMYLTCLRSVIDVGHDSGNIEPSATVQ